MSDVMLIYSMNCSRRMSILYGSELTILFIKDRVMNMMPNCELYANFRMDVQYS